MLLVTRHTRRLAGGRSLRAAAAVGSRAAPRLQRRVQNATPAPRSQVLRPASATHSSVSSCCGRHKCRSRVSEKCSAVGTGYPRARRALHVEQRCSTLAPVGRLGRRKLAASLARRATIFDRISKDFAPPKPQNFLRAAPYGRGRPMAGALRARRPTARYPRSDPTSETRAFLVALVGL